MPAASSVLAAPEREFFARVAEVTYMNPFAPERMRILARLIGRAAARPGEAAVNALLPEMNSRIARLDAHGVATLERFHAEDRPLMRSVFLYQIYHRYLADFDRVTEEQLHGRNAAVPFAARMIADLAHRGFSDADALHYLASFFALRRAFYFIVKSLIGESASMQQLRFALWNNIFTNDLRAFDRALWARMEDFSTLLLGETGTGKGSAAAAMGRSGYIPFDRAQGRFVASFTETFIATNLSQFPETLIESELFGHRKGAFTGAVDNHRGLFARCSRYGALFLDEIGEISVPVQIKLLQVLQERTFVPVGSHEAQRFAGRVIAATNKPIAQLRVSGRFRDDFFYRLCSDVITLPTLRERLEEDSGELERLVKSQLARLTGEADPGDLELVLHTFKRLPRHYSWPGNVRELEQAVRRVLLTHHYSGDAGAALATSPAHVLAAEMHEGSLDARSLLGRYCRLLYEQLGTIEAVARRSGLDRRTVKKYIIAEEVAHAKDEAARAP